MSETDIGLKKIERLLDYLMPKFNLVGVDDVGETELYVTTKDAAMEIVKSVGESNLVFDAGTITVIQGNGADAISDYSWKAGDTSFYTAIEQFEEDEENE